MATWTFRIFARVSRDHVRASTSVIHVTAQMPAAAGIALQSKSVHDIHGVSCTRYIIQTSDCKPGNQCCALLA